MLRALVVVFSALVTTSACKSSGSAAPAAEGGADTAGGREDSRGAPGPVVDTEPPPPVVCGRTTCAPGEECLPFMYARNHPEDYELYSCELRCPEGQCPAGKKCVTIDGGPGPVCR